MSRLWEKPYKEEKEQSYYSIFLVYDEAMREEIEQLLSFKRDISYEIIESIISVPLNGEPRLKNEIWPSNGEIMSLVLKKEEKEKLKNLILEFNRKVIHPNEIIKFYSFEIEDIIL